MTLGALFPQMLDALVDGLRPLLSRFRSSRRLVVVESDAGFRFIAVDRGKATSIADGEPDAKQLRKLKRAARGAVELRLAPERLIARSLELPAAGREYLAPIVEHRLERLTPWRPDKVVYGFAVAGVPASDGAMAVDFLATSADIAADRTDRLARFDVVPTALGSAAEPVETPLRIDLYRGARDVGRRRLRRAVAIAVILLAVVLAPAFGLSQWLSMQADERLATLEQRLATKRAVLRAATGDTEAESRDLRLINGKTPVTAAMVLVDTLAGLLPDGTFLRELEIDGPKIRIAGLSSDAPALIPVLEADEALADVRFSAPVTRDDAGRDGFDIVARWIAREAPPAGARDALRPDDPLQTGALP
ncbi:MAG TPA: PilN domain-containing protein [Methylomirabilota bacterium]|nr:PilN domain-containing protein [Methylomirabilota bacterium]